MKAFKLKISELGNWQMTLPLAIAAYALLLFFFSSLRHALFHSGALDLGYHDQVLYLLSIDKPPIISFWGYHFLGGHAEWIYYILQGLYRIYPDVHLLFAIQAVSLSIAAWPIVKLARQAGLNRQQVRTIAIAYWLYPLIFNINLFDFHPEVIAVPLILTSVWSARARKPVVFAIATTLILGCRASLSLLVTFMGLWLILFEKRRIYGIYALISGSLWFLIFTRILVPIFKPDGYHAISRYGELGDSIAEAIANLFLRPDIAVRQLFTLANLEYLILLFIPVLWGISVRYLAPLLAALPILGMNLLTSYTGQKDLIHQYSLPIVPFLMIMSIGTMASEKGLFKQNRWIIAWTLVVFMALAKFGYFWSLYLENIDTVVATRQAVEKVETKGGVLTSSRILPHLSHRKLIHIISPNSLSENLGIYQYVLLNLDHAHPDEGGYETFKGLQFRLAEEEDFELIFARDSVYLFEKI
ncbi:MAG: DUF2079 domain-containing protein [Cyanobacteriota bacterium]|nr:DUF2079 domain-containing protein [Cyanobacteriota bacterium]